MRDQIGVANKGARVVVVVSQRHALSASVIFAIRKRRQNGRSRHTRARSYMTPLNIASELHQLLSQIRSDSPMVGSLADGRLRMPRHSNDGRNRTWHKTIDAIAKRVCNHPSSRNDCWLVPPNTTNGLYSVKLSPSGSRNKWCGPRVVFALANPEELEYIEERRSEKHVAHRCGNGAAANATKAVCLNPYHLVLVPSAENQDHKGCKYGCALLCPHQPTCVFVSRSTGQFRPCLNALDTLIRPELCAHVPRCFNNTNTASRLHARSAAK